MLHIKSLVFFFFLHEKLSAPVIRSGQLAKFSTTLYPMPIRVIFLSLALFWGHTQSIKVLLLCLCSEITLEISGDHLESWGLNLHQLLAKQVLYLLCYNWSLQWFFYRQIEGRWKLLLDNFLVKFIYSWNFVSVWKLKRGKLYAENNQKRWEFENRHIFNMPRYSGLSYPKS